MTEINSRKIAIIGCGFVGSACAFALMQSGLFSEMVLIDSNEERAEGEALDISHGLPFSKPMQIYSGTYDDITDAGIIAITAGVRADSNLCTKMLKYSNLLFPKFQKEITRAFC